MFLGQAIDLGPIAFRQQTGKTIPPRPKTILQFLLEYALFKRPRSVKIHREPSIINPIANHESATALENRTGNHLPHNHVSHCAARSLIPFKTTAQSPDGVL